MLLVVVQPLQLHGFSDAEFAEDIDLMLHLFGQLVQDESAHLRVHDCLLALEVLHVDDDVGLEVDYLGEGDLSHQQEQLVAIRRGDSEVFAQGKGLMAARPARSALRHQDDIFLLLVELDQLHVADLSGLSGGRLEGKGRPVEIKLAAGDKLEIIGISAFGNFKEGDFWELFEEMAVVFRRVELFVADELQFQVFFEEEGSGEEVEVGGSEVARDDDDADLGHIDGQLEDEVRQRHRRILKHLPCLAGQQGQSIADDRILVAEVLEKLFFFMEDVLAVLEQTGGEFGVGSDEFVEDAELADDLIDEVVEGEVSLGLRMEGE